MAMQKRVGWCTLAIGLVLCTTTARAWAVDTDGDGVDDAIDACFNTPVGTQVDIEGRPLGDVDQDCDVDLDDFALFQQTMTGPIPAPPGMVLVPGGEFDMGDPWSEGGTDERPVHDVYLSPYYMDRHEVTNQQYCEYLNSALGQGLILVTNGVVYKAGDSEPYCDTSTSSSYSRIHWSEGVFSVAPGKEDHPMVLVSWYGAVAYCNWRSAENGRTSCYNLSTWECDFEADGYRLPTEAEWEKAASWDPLQQRHFRFGEHTDGCGTACLNGQRANYSSSGDPYELGAEPWTTPVTFYNGELHDKLDFGWPGSEASYQTQDAQSYYGCYDMSGNVGEWCHDWWGSTYYDSSPYDNPTGPASGSVRIYRGGTWYYSPGTCRSASRLYDTPGWFAYYVGFRCAVGEP